MKKPIVIIDTGIPFIEGRLDNIASVYYLPTKGFTSSGISNADALLVRTRTKCGSGLLKDSKVQFISTASIGMDHIDVDWCRQNDITVESAPGCNAPGVAQYVLASLLHSGFDPKHDTLGIVGYGHVGQVVADWATKSGIKILVNDPPRKLNGEKDIEYHELEDLLQHCDAVTLHVPLTESGSHPTKGLIGERELKMMKPGAFIVNSSRGGVIVEKDLKRFIRERDLKAIIDVWKNEPELDRELLGLVKSGTPHIAGYSMQGKLRATGIALNALSDYFGLKINTDDLFPVPDKQREIDAELIMASYNPSEDFKRLNEDPSGFEKQRDNYQFRAEPLFMNETQP